MNNQNDQVHVIDILRGRGVQNVVGNDMLHEVSSSRSEENRYSGSSQAVGNNTPLSTSGRAQAVGNNTPLSTSGRLNPRNSSLLRRSDQYGQRNRSPLNSGLWISVELVVTMSQIIASIVVLALSRHENPQAPLFAWVVGYASGCVATVPILYWRFCNRNQGLAQESDQPHGTNFNDQAYGSSLSMPMTADGNRNNMGTTSLNSRIVGPVSFRFNGVMDHFKMALDCFFAVWFVVGNVWIFGGHTSPSDAPKLYRLCIVFLTFSCIGYAMPFILCATICCCLPCVISLLGFREEFSQNRGATPDIINTFPVHKFKLKKSVNIVDPENNSGVGEGGVLAAGTENERLISGEDAVCCICLGKYGDGDELRELSCLHFFHVECVDKWLKISAICPLCKSHVGPHHHSSSSPPL